MRHLSFIICHLSFSVALCVALAACSHIDEDERLIYEKPAPVTRAVLLEDFTGQRCANCPRGTDVINALHAELGDSTVIAVSIHGGPLAFKGNARSLGLATALGDEYYSHWRLDYQPVALVDRHGAVNYTDWTRAVKEELTKTAPLQLNVAAALAGNDIHITVSALGTDGGTTGRLQVWLLEDSITAMQTMPDGKVNTSYVHNHVLRTAVNGTWGEDFTIAEGETKTVAMSQPLSEEWRSDQLTVVAFVYNDEGVQQAAKARARRP